MILVEYWRCLGGYQPGVGSVPCDAHGEGPGSDLAARKHMDATGHGTVSGSRPTTTTTASAGDAT